MNSIEIYVIDGREYTTCFNIEKCFGITRQKINYAIKKDKITAIMESYVDKLGVEFKIYKWFVLYDDSLKTFIMKNRKY